MNNVRRQELGNELQSSQHLRLQSASRKLLDIPTLPAGSGKVQRKKPIAGIKAGDFLSVGITLWDDGLSFRCTVIPSAAPSRACAVRAREGPGVVRYPEAALRWREPRSHDCSG